MLRPITCSVVRFEQKILKICDFKAISVTKIFFLEKNLNFLKNFQKSKNFKMLQKWRILLRFCSNEHMIEMRRPFVDFWQKKSFGKFFEKFWNSTKILKNRIFSKNIRKSPMCLMCHMCTHHAHISARLKKS